MIHFHGGLRTKTQALRTVRFVDDAYREANAVPVFFIYDVGLLESVWKGYHRRGLFGLADYQGLSLERRARSCGPSTRGGVVSTAM